MDEMVDLEHVPNWYERNFMYIFSVYVFILVIAMTWMMSYALARVAYSECQANNRIVNAQTIAMTAMFDAAIEPSARTPEQLATMDRILDNITDRLPTEDCDHPGVLPPLP